jgi:hypothetical protein
MRTCGKRGAHTKSTSESVDPRWSISNSRLMSPTVDAALGCQAGQGEEQVQGTKDGRGVSRLRRGACPRMIEPSVHAHVRRRARAPRARAATRRSARALALCCRWEEGEHGGVDWTQLGPIRRPPCYKQTNTNVRARARAHSRRISRTPLGLRWVGVLLVFTTPPPRPITNHGCQLHRH